MGTRPRVPSRTLSVDLGEGDGQGERHYLAELFRDSLDPGYADAAARRGTAAGGPVTGGPAAGEPPAEGPASGGAGRSGWRGGRAVALLTLVVLGLVLAVAYRQVVADEPTRTQVRADLEQQISELGGTTDALQERAGALRDEVAELRDRELADPQARALRELEAATGLIGVTGDGVVVRVDDGPPVVDPASGEPVIPPEARILDLDLQRITNGLWAAGAEAIAINDHRLTATSTIRNASGAILVDRVPVAGPYELVAIGPDELAERFAGSVTGAQMQQLVGDYGIAYEVRAADDLALPAAATPALHYAVPAGGDS